MFRWRIGLLVASIFTVESIGLKQDDLIIELAVGQVRDRSTDRRNSGSDSQAYSPGRKTVAK